MTHTPIIGSSSLVENITFNARLLAVVLRTHYQAESIQFFTPSDFSQQLGYMNRPSGYVIPPHVHNPVPREVQYTKEVLFIKSGRVRVDFYDVEQNYLETSIPQSGIVTLFEYGRHGFRL